MIHPTAKVSEEANRVGTSPYELTPTQVREISTVRPIGVRPQMRESHV